MGVMKRGRWSTLVLKPRADIIRSSEKGDQWPYKKAQFPSNIFKTYKDKGCLLHEKYMVFLNGSFYPRLVFHNIISDTSWERLIRSHSSARFCFELSGNSNKQCILNMKY